MSLLYRIIFLYLFIYIIKNECDNTPLRENAIKIIYSK
jgi:hypothetical protein